MHQIGHYLATGEHLPEPGLAGKLSLLLEHYDALLELYGPVVGVNNMRKHISWYTSGLPSSAEFRNNVNRIADPNIAKQMVRDFFGKAMEAPIVLKSAA